MKFLLDANVSSNIATVLREAGHDACELVGKQRTLPDEEVLALAVQDECIVITSDKDFGYLVIFEQLPHCGIILLRLPKTPVREMPKFILEVVRQYADRLSTTLTVVTEDRVRFHASLPPKSP